jgi:hypothetical protein
MMADNDPKQEVEGEYATRSAAYSSTLKMEEAASS